MMYDYHKESATGAQIDIDRLKELGDQGWRLVTSNRDVFYFMREIDPSVKSQDDKKVKVKK